MRCCGLESSKSLNCPGNCLSCAHHLLLLLLLLLLLVLLSDGAAPLARRTSYLQIHCLGCCCLSDWMFHAEPFMQTQDTQMSKPAFTITPTPTPVNRRDHGWVCVWLCVFIGGGWKLLSRTVNTHYTVYKYQCMLQLNWTDAIVFYSVHSMSKQMPPCPVPPDDYVYSTETMELHVNT